MSYEAYDYKLASEVKHACGLVRNSGIRVLYSVV